MKKLILLLCIFMSLPFIVSALTKSNAWEQEWITLTMYNGQIVRVKKAEITAYKYFPKYAYTDVFVGCQNLEVQESVEEIDFQLGRAQ